MNQKNGRTDPGPLRERARSLFISQATIDETLEWATPTSFAMLLHDMPCASSTLIRCCTDTGTVIPFLSRENRTV